jgi:hypothetical protein
MTYDLIEARKNLKEDRYHFICVDGTTKEVISELSFVKHFPNKHKINNNVVFKSIQLFGNEVIKKLIKDDIL